MSPSENQPSQEIPFKEKIRSIQFNGQGMRIPRTKVIDGKKHVELLDEDGKYAGHEIQHKSGRQDAVANFVAPPPVTVQM